MTRSAARISIAFLIGALLLHAQSLADTRLLSRESHVRAYETMYTFPDRVFYDEHGEFFGPGAWDISLPHAPRHREVATDTLIEGSFSGFAQRSPRLERIGSRSATMTAAFSVVDQPVSASLTYNGFIDCSWLGATDGNIVLTLTHIESGVEVFNIYRDGSPVLWNREVLEWSTTTWTSMLDVGTYEFKVHANVTRIEFRGSGISNGSGYVSASLSLVPCPAMAPLLALPACLRTRRSPSHSWNRR